MHRKGLHQAREAFVRVSQRVCGVCGGVPVHVGWLGWWAGRGVVGLVRVARPSRGVARHPSRGMFHVIAACPKAVMSQRL